MGESETLLNMANTKISQQEFLSLLQRLLNEKIPADNLISLGAAIAGLKFEDWKSVGGNLFTKDIKPIYHSSKKKIISFKELRKNIKDEGPKSFFKNMVKSSVQSATVNIPDAKNRVTTFTKKIANDYSQLKTNEDRGSYILKLSLYSGVFALAFQKGAKQKMLSRSTLPLIALGVSLVVMSRVLEEAEKNLEEKPGAKKLAQDIRSLVRTLNTGFSSGMTFNIMVDGIVDQKIQINDMDGKSIGSLMPKSIIDNMIYTTLMGLFSNEAKDS